MLTSIYVIDFHYHDFVNLLGLFALNIIIVDDEFRIDLLFKTVDWYQDPRLTLQRFKAIYFDLLILDIKNA